MVKTLFDYQLGAFGNIVVNLSLYVLYEVWIYTIDLYQDKISPPYAEGEGKVKDKQ